MSVTIKWNSGAKKNLLNTPTKIMYAIGRQLLDEALPTIPMASGTMRKTSMSSGVRTDGTSYWVGSYTDYAEYVNKMPDKTNWTTPGTTGNWFDKMWKRKKAMIIKRAIDLEGLK